MLTRLSPIILDDQLTREVWRLSKHALQRQLREQSRHGAVTRATERTGITTRGRLGVMVGVAVELDGGRLMTDASHSGGIGAVRRATVARDDRRQRGSLQQQPRGRDGTKATAKGSHTRHFSA